MVPSVWSRPERFRHTDSVQVQFVQISSAQHPSPLAPSELFVSKLILSRLDPSNFVSFDLDPSLSIPAKLVSPH